MLKGLDNVTYFVDDMKAAVDWYKSTFDIEPVYESEFFTSFKIGDYGLGLHPSNDDDKPGHAGQTAYWAVGNAKEAMEHLVGAGATEYHEVTDVGGGRKIASIKDPFGNIFGVIEIPGA